MPNRKCVVFIDDLCLTAESCEGNLELLRQFLDQRGFHDRREWHWKHVVNTSVICSSTLQSSLRLSSNRLASHFNFLQKCEPDQKEIFSICSAPFLDFLKDKNFEASILKQSRRFVEATIEVCSLMKSELLPVPCKSLSVFGW